MAVSGLTDRSVGWIGTGRMGAAMVRRMLAADIDVTVWNRTRSKAEPLVGEGASIVDRPCELGGCDIVFTMVGGPDDFVDVTLGQDGLLGGDEKPEILVDSTSINSAASAQVRSAAAEMGVSMLAAPVSGNDRAAAAGLLTFAVSGPKESYDAVEPLFACIGRGSSWVGEGELARFIKICHNVFLGVVIQNLVEITVLAEKAGVPRHAFLAFLNDSALGSIFTRYKTPALVNLDYSVTFTPRLLLKDMDLGLAAGREFEVPLPLASTAREILQSLIGKGYSDQDFAALLSLQAEASGLELKPENVEVSDGLNR